MSGQINIRDRIKANYIKSYPFITSVYDILQFLIVNARIITEIAFRSLTLVPVQVKKKKIHLVSCFPIFMNLIHCYLFALVQASAINYQCFSDKLTRWELVKRCPACEQMRWWIHMCTCVSNIVTL